MKIPFHPIESVRNPPNTGEATGATPLMAPMMAIALARSLPVKRSVAMERDTTIPPAPATPCIRRKKMKLSIEVDSRQHTVDTIKSAMAASSGERRP